MILKKPDTLSKKGILELLANRLECPVESLSFIFERSMHDMSYKEIMIPDNREAMK